jgi:DNA repair protein RecN (Recombination protein N)
MLKRLSITQFVIIESLTVDFAGGLTVLTGETGAGKSILLDAMGLILGEDPDREAVRQGSSESVIEAVLDPPPEHAVWAFLAKQDGLDVAGPELRIRRAIDRGTKDEILVNGKAIDLQLLKRLGTYLVEIHGQFANANFLAPENQLLLLDAYGAFPAAYLENVAQAWNDIGRITKEIQEEKIFYAGAEREKAGIERVLAAIDKIELEDGMYQKLVADLAHLIETRDISDIFHAINAQLVAQAGAELILTRVDHSLATQKDPALDKMKECIKTALENTRTAITEMQILAPKYLDIDTSGIHKIEKILLDIRTLAAERKVPPEELYNHYETLVDRLDRIKAAPGKIKELGDALDKANVAYLHHAKILTDARTKAALKLGAAINAEMAPLKLPSAQIKIEVVEDTTKRSALGSNEVCFSARMNPGMPFSPIAKTASGGELARLILAIKMILQQVQAVSTLVFDEIDTGIGGAAAAAVGSRIAKLAGEAQILVITHSPQVASRGDQHLHVSKATDGKTTRTVVRTLTLEERIDEVSRMLAGEEITGESQAAARTLIEEARAAAEKRRAEVREQKEKRERIAAEAGSDNSAAPMERPEVLPVEAIPAGEATLAASTPPA